MFALLALTGCSSSDDSESTSENGVSDTESTFAESQESKTAFAECFERESGVELEAVTLNEEIVSWVIPGGIVWDEASLSQANEACIELNPALDLSQVIALGNPTPDEGASREVGEESAEVALPETPPLEPGEIPTTTTTQIEQVATTTSQEAIPNANPDFDSRSERDPALGPAPEAIAPIPETPTQADPIDEPTETPAPINAPSEEDLAVAGLPDESQSNPEPEPEPVRPDAAEGPPVEIWTCIDQAFPDITDDAFVLIHTLLTENANSFPQFEESENPFRSVGVDSQSETRIRGCVS